MFFPAVNVYGVDLAVQSSFVSEGAIVETHLSPRREKRGEIGP